MNNVYQRLNAVMAELKPIGKDSKNVAQGFKFRSIDAIYDALHGLLAKHGLIICPTVDNHEIKDYDSFGKDGIAKKTFHSTITMNYKIYGLEGDFVEVSMVGDALDNGDKSVSKSETMAYKYMLIQLFTLALSGVDDPDGDTVTVESKKPAKKPEVDPLLTALKKACIEAGIDDAYVSILYPKVKNIDVGSFEEFATKVGEIYDSLAG